jgi:broad specificity phosphatase PhoE
MPTQRQLDLETEWRGKVPASGYKSRRDTALPTDGKDRIRGQVDLPLDRIGQSQAFMLWVGLRPKGCFDKIYHTGLIRSIQTAKALCRGKTIPLLARPKLVTMNYGIYEGALAAEAEPKILDYIRNKPDENIPEGESFNGFKNRVLAALDERIAEHKATPTLRVGMVLNGRTIKVKKGHFAAGSPPPKDGDYSIDCGVATEKIDGSEETGSIFRLDYKNNRFEAVDLGSKEPLKPGLYVIRHAHTAWNGPVKKDDGN